MLVELNIRNFAIISQLKIEFGRGFNILTGETGAGKSIILDAVSLILGGRAGTTLIRAGSKSATVEALFQLDGTVQALMRPILSQYDLIDEDSDERELLISRELKETGRNVCRINGFTTRTSVLREIGEILIGIHGQGEHLALLKAKAHLPLLDAYANLTSEVESLGRIVKGVLGLQKEEAELRANRDLTRNRIEMLKFKVEEIDAANLVSGEDAELSKERDRLANTDQLMRSTAESLSLLTGFENSDGDTMSISDLVGQLEGSLSLLSKLDPTQKELFGRVQGVASELDDVSSTLRTYEDNLEHDPTRLTQIEERIDLINRLKKKYGSEIIEIIKGRDAAQQELDKLESSDERLDELGGLIETGLKKVGKLAQALSKKRKAAGEKLAREVEKELGDLRMNARFGVDFQEIEDPAGAFIDDRRLKFDATGTDRVEFMLSANPGEPLKPVEKVASGGETARIMLALKTALARVDSTPTLIFDEIDQGIGGRIGAVVGEKLWSLSGRSNHQVICVTHLAQMAGFGDVHFQVQKSEAEGRTSTAVRQLDHQERVDELADMLGLKDDLAKVNARSLLKEAEKIKAH
ncbi:MAG: DNA repair protein RecN [Chloroflexota bacterium]